jgi:hypothetical protein
MKSMKSKLNFSYNFMSNLIEIRSEQVGVATVAL